MFLVVAAGHAQAGRVLSQLIELVAVHLREVLELCQQLFVILPASTFMAIGHFKQPCHQILNAGTLFAQVLQHLSGSRQLPS